MMSALSVLAAGWSRGVAAPVTPPPSQGATVDSSKALMDVEGIRDLLLDVIVNGASIHMLGEFRDKHGEIYAARKELESLGFRLPPRAPGTTPDTLIQLSKLPGFSYKLDEGTQTISITVTASGLKPTELGPPQSEASTLPVRSGLGAVMNYSLAATYADHHVAGEMLLDARAFTPWAVAESSFTITNVQGLQSAPVVRLDTSVTVSDTGTLRQYTLGDLISGGLDWSRPVRLGGFQISTNFGIRPDLTTFPVPTISGEVAVPSSVDVLVNGIQELSQPVPPGPFEIRQLPVITGVGDVSVVTRDATGQQTTQTLQLYSSRQLVKPGLTDFSAELGFVRLDYGTLSDDYRAPAASASIRLGLSNWLTLEGHAEASDGGGLHEGVKIEPGGMAGGGAALGLGGLGVVSADIAGSRFGARSGGLASVGYERIAPHVSVSLSAQATTGSFGDIASNYGDPVPSLQLRGILGFSWSALGSFGLAFTEQRRPGSPAQAALFPVDEEQSVAREDFGLVPLALASKISLLSLSYSRSFFNERAFLSATAFHDFSHDGGGTGATMSLTFPIGRRSSISVEGDDDSGSADGVVQASQTSPDIGDFGYSLREEAGEQPRQLAIGTYRSPWGVMDAGVDHSSSGTALHADLQGAVAAAGGGIFPSLPITDSFAVVDTDGTPGVQVLQENRPVGRTNASGKLLVTDLRAFDANRLGIDPADIPIDADAGPTTQLVRPRDRSGVVVHFKMKAGHGAVVVLDDEGKKPLLPGDRARLEGAGTAYDLVVGYDGEVYVTGLQPHNRVTVLLQNNARCVAEFDYVSSPGQIPRIGPVVCPIAGAP
jgi:outer membrane usher protein